MKQLWPEKQRRLPKTGICHLIFRKKCIIMLIRQDKGLKKGYNSITSLDDESNITMMDFGILVLDEGETYEDAEGKEKAYLLLKGGVVFEWDGERAEARRDSFFDENPVALSVPSNTAVKVTSLSADTQICITRTYNDRQFSSRYYSKEDCRSEMRGRGTMGETSTRIVRTIFDYTNARESNLVLGEVITYPGKWSSYPPHHHPQPEIYYYRFLPEQGFGFAMLGDEVVKVHDHDTVVIDNVSHPQTAAPGYAMFYVWVIRHIDGNPYITPIFEAGHTWVTDKNARIWPDK